jgi:kynurenine 3-monooxygenase
MRDRTAHLSFKLKKKLDHALNRWMPNAFVPLYDLVSFTTVPYAKARARARRQDRLVLDAAIALGALLVVAAAFVGDRLLRSPGATP